MKKEIFQASGEAKAKATQLRVFAVLSWLLAVGVQIIAISKLLKPDLNMVWIISLIGLDLIFAILGSILWKKSNKLDPASEKNKLMFFMQSQLGLVVAVIAFLPLIIFILKSKNLNTKQKGILGGIAALALVIAGISGIDFNPPSIEKYTEEINQQTEHLKQINFDNENVFWTTHGNKYHIHKDCQHIKDKNEIFNGTVKESWESKGISELCKTCEKKAIRSTESENPDPLNETKMEQKTE